MKQKKNFFFEELTVPQLKLSVLLLYKENPALHTFQGKTAEARTFSQWLHILAAKLQFCFAAPAVNLTSVSIKNHNHVTCDRCAEKKWPLVEKTTTKKRPSGLTEMESKSFCVWFVCWCIINDTAVCVCVPHVVRWSASRLSWISAHYAAEGPLGRG